METFWQDLKQAARVLRKDPGFTAVAVLTLSLGIGANTAVFSVVRAVLLKPLPYPAANRLVVVWAHQTGNAGGPQQISYPDFEDLRKQTSAFEDIGAIYIDQWTLTGSGDPLVARGLRATPSFFTTLGLHAALGRVFLSEEGQPGKDNVVLLSHRLWQARFGADPSLIGRMVILDGEPCTVLGVLPRDFNFELPLTPDYTIAGADIWRPLNASHFLAGSRQVFTYEVLARLRSEVALAQAQDNLNLLGHQLEAAYPATNTGRGFDLVPLQEQVTGRIRPVLLVIAAAAGLVLLIACTNLANLLLARGASRRREVFIRAALGASRMRLLRQMLTESALLALLGGAAGVWLATWTREILLRLPGANLIRSENIRLDTGVLLFSLGISVIAAAFFSLIPGLLVTRENLEQALREAGRSASGARHSNAREMLVSSQVALASMLLVASLLLGLSLRALLAVNPGFQTDNLISFELTVPEGRYPHKVDAVAFFYRLRASLESLPEVRSANLVSDVPLSGQSVGSALWIKGQVLRAGQQPPSVGWQMVSPAYFHALGVPLVHGREFTLDDLSRATHSTIISESFAREFFPGINPVGQFIQYGVPDEKNPDWHEIIGIVGDVRHTSLDAAHAPRGYDLVGQHWDRTLSIVVRTQDEPARAMGAIRGQVRSLDPELPLDAVRTIDQLVSDSTASRRFVLILVGCFAALALVLAAVGIYGVVAHTVTAHTQEIGVRIALGAQRRDVLSLVLKQGLRFVFAGLAVGIAGALSFARYLSSLLYGVRATNPLAITCVAGTITLVAVAACVGPVRRAMRVDPMVALRYE